jgi:hypothetical protein
VKIAGAPGVERPDTSFVTHCRPRSELTEKLARSTPARHLRLCRAVFYPRIEGGGWMGHRRSHREAFWDHRRALRGRSDRMSVWGGRAVGVLFALTMLVAVALFVSELAP